MFVSCSSTVYQTRLIKKMFDTQISELSNDGPYDFFPYPEIHLTYPLGGEKIYASQGSGSIMVTWDTELPQFVPYVTVSYSIDDQPYVEAGRSVNFGAFSWGLNSNVQPETNTYKIKVNSNYTIRTSGVNGTAVDRQDTAASETANPFSIAYRSITVLPVGTILSFSAGSDETLAIPFVVNNTSDYVKIFAYAARVDNATVLNERFYIQGATNSYTVKMSDLKYVSDVHIKIRVQDVNNPDVWSDSDAFLVKGLPPIS